MFRLLAAFLAAVSLRWACCAQTLPRDIAWAAYGAAQHNRKDLVPSLARLVASYAGGPIDDRATVPPQAAAIEAVADALIQLQASLPADAIMHLYPQFPAQTIILLSRAPDNVGPLLEIFRNTRSRDLWLAAGNLLAVRPPPGFARSLLDGVVATFVFRVVPQPDNTGSGIGSGCAADFSMVPDDAFRDWPKARMYSLVTGRHPRNIFAPGIHPVGFSYWETTDYRDPWTDGDCSRTKSTYWRTGLLAELQGTNLDDFPLAPETQETVPYRSASSFEDSVQAAIQKQAAAFEDVLESLLRSGALSIEDSLSLGLKCRIEIEDTRPWTRSELPKVEGRWCTPAPPKAGNTEPPE